MIKLFQNVWVLIEIDVYTSNNITRLGILVLMRCVTKFVQEDPTKMIPADQSSGRHSKQLNQSSLITGSLTTI